MNKTGYSIYGRRCFSIRGSLPETVLNACAAKGIEIREAEFRDDHCISVWVYEKDAAEFRKTAEECLCFIDTEKKTGGKRILLYFKRNIPAVMIGSFFAICLFLSSLFIWDIDVVGNTKLTEGEIKRALADCGICAGCFWPGIDNDTVRAEMITELPELAWMSVNVNGSRATVPVLERKAPAEIYSEKGHSDLTAKTDGIVERTFVRNGKTVINRGQTVEKGTVLVSGELDSSTGRTEFVRSRGEVYARTRREVTAVCPETVMKKASRGKSHKRYAMMFGKTRINFYSESKNTVDESDKTIHNIKLGLKGIFTFPITLISEEFLPYTCAEKAAPDIEKMKSTLRGILEKEVDGEILSIGFVSGTENGLEMVTVQCECLENIAEEKAVK